MNEKEKKVVGYGINISHKNASFERVATFNDENVAKAPYIRSDLHHSITVQTEFLEECSVLRFREQQNGSMKLWGKKEMNARLGKNRSMDLLDPIAMRMLPCANIPYGDELESGFADAKNAEDDYYEQNNNAETVNIYDEHTWY